MFYYNRLPTIRLRPARGGGGGRMHNRLIIDIIIQMVFYRGCRQNIFVPAHFFNDNDT